MTHAHTIRYEPPHGPTSPGTCITCGQDGFVGENVVPDEQENDAWSNSATRGSEAGARARKAKQTGWMMRRDQFKYGAQDANQ